jgi:hypothetical protein
MGTLFYNAAEAKLGGVCIQHTSAHSKGLPGGPMKFFNYREKGTAHTA